MTQQHIINPLDILARLSWGESDDLEFKSGRGGLPKSLWETYSAMANTQGGVILLGVEDDGSVSGIGDTAHIRKNFWDTVLNRGKVSTNLLNNDDVQEVEHPEGTLLAIRVPRATRYQGPVFIGQNPLTGTYRRNSDGLLSRFLTPMVEHNRLQLRYPDKPNRTDQAYKASSKSTSDVEKSQADKLDFQQ